MTYEETVLKYANMVQVYSPDGTRLLQLLDQKIKQYSLMEDFERRDFWVQVNGDFVRKESYVELERFKSNESIHRNQEILFNLGMSNSSITRTYEWIMTLPKLEDYVCKILDYAAELDETYQSTEQESEDCTRASLDFFYQVTAASNFTDRSRFYFLPLTIWAVENLLIYNRYSQRFNSFLLNSFIPLLRKHRIAANKFAALINEEPCDDNDASVLNSSNLFNAQYTFSEEIIDNPNEVVDLFTGSLARALVSGDFRYVELDQAKKDRRVNPLYSAYRSLSAAEKLSCLDHFEYIVTPSIALSINKKLDTQITTYSQDNIKYVILSGIHNLISAPHGSPLRHMAMWDEMERAALTKLDNLIRAEVLTVDSGIEIRAFIRASKIKFSATV